jgi:hypothetical protein
MVIEVKTDTSQLRPQLEEVRKITSGSPNVVKVTAKMSYDERLATQELNKAIRSAERDAAKARVQVALDAKSVNISPEVAAAARRKLQQEALFNEMRSQRVEDRVSRFEAGRLFSIDAGKVTIAAAGAALLGSQLERSALTLQKLAGDWNALDVSGRIVQIGAAVPFIGEFVRAGQAIRELLVGEQASLDQMTRSLATQNNLWSEQMTAIQGAKRAAEDHLLVIQKIRDSSQVIGMGGEGKTRTEAINTMREQEDELRTKRVQADAVAVSAGATFDTANTKNREQIDRMDEVLRSRFDPDLIAYVQDNRKGKGDRRQAIQAYGERHGQDYGFDADVKEARRAIDELEGLRESYANSRNAATSKARDDAKRAAEVEAETLQKNAKARADLDRQTRERIEANKSTLAVNAPLVATESGEQPRLREPAPAQVSLQRQPEQPRLREPERDSAQVVALKRERDTLVRQIERNKASGADALAMEADTSSLAVINQKIEIAKRKDAADTASAQAAQAEATLRIQRRTYDADLAAFDEATRAKLESIGDLDAKSNEAARRAAQRAVMVAERERNANANVQASFAQAYIARLQYAGHYDDAERERFEESARQRLERAESLTPKEQAAERNAIDADRGLMEQRIRRRRDDSTSSLNARIDSAQARIGGQDQLAGIVSQLSGMASELRDAPAELKGLVGRAQLTELKAMESEILRPRRYAQEWDASREVAGGPTGDKGAEIVSVLRMIQIASETTARNAGVPILQ